MESIANHRAYSDYVQKAGQISKTQGLHVGCMTNSAGCRVESECVRGGIPERPEGSPGHSPGQRPGGNGLHRIPSPERAPSECETPCRPFRASDGPSRLDPRALPWVVPWWPFRPFRKPRWTCSHHNSPSSPAESVTDPSRCLP